MFFKLNKHVIKTHIFMSDVLLTKYLKKKRKENIYIIFSKVNYKLTYSVNLSATATQGKWLDVKR